LDLALRPSLLLVVKLQVVLQATEKPPVVKFIRIACIPIYR